MLQNAEKYLMRFKIHGMMGIYTTKPIQEINAIDFQYLIKGKQVVISPHALWHLSNQIPKYSK